MRCFYSFTNVASRRARGGLFFAPKVPQMDNNADDNRGKEAVHVVTAIHCAKANSTRREGSLSIASSEERVLFRCRRLLVSLSLSTKMFAVELNPIRFTAPGCECNKTIDTFWSDCCDLRGIENGSIGVILLFRLLKDAEQHLVRSGKKVTSITLANCMEDEEFRNRRVDISVF